MTGETPEAAAVLEANAELYAAVETGDLDRMNRLWAEAPYAASVTCVHPGWSSLRGRDEVLRSWAVIMANTSYIQFFLTDIEVELSGDVAVVTCAENILTAVGDDTDESALAGGKVMATNVFRRVGEGWRLWLHHGSPVLAAGQADEEG